MTDLRRALRALSPIALSDELLSSIEEAYARPARRYHTIEHVREVAERFEEVARGPGWKRPREVFLAVLFHDAVYVTGRSDNEVLSADLARAAIANFLSSERLDADRVAELILWTARHGTLSPEDVDAEAALFLDCDMAILGSERDRFFEYDRAIAEEYAEAVPPDLFRFGRRAFFERLLQKDRIYLSDFFRDRLEAAARANLKAVLEAQ